MAGRGIFVVVEGIEGAGKTTQTALLSEWLESRGIDHVATREPGGTAVGEAIRAVLLHRVEIPMPAETELFLILGARAAFVRDVVRPALDAGRVVIADRFSYSTLAYQGYGRGLDLGRVRDVEAFATGGLEPDLYVILDVSVAGGAARQEADEKPGDRFERSGTAFLERVRAGYLELAAASDRAALVDATAPVHDVQAQILELLVSRFPETFAQRRV